VAAKRPLTRPATAGENAVAGHPLPQGEGSLLTKNVRTPVHGLRPRLFTASRFAGQETYRQNGFDLQKCGSRVP